MEGLFESLFRDKAAAKIAALFGASGQRNLIYGLSGSQKSAVVAASYSKSPRPTVIVAAGREAVDMWLLDLRTYLPEAKIVELPALDMVEVAAAAKSVELAARRMTILGRLLRREQMIVVTTAQAAVQKGLSRQEFERGSLRLQLGDVIERETVLSKLVGLGYEHVSQIESIGQFSARGGIVDIFPINGLEPVRLEFFDNEIDSIRVFELETQRSINNITALDVMPLAGIDGQNEKVTFLSYLAEDAAVLVDEPARVREKIIALVKENPEFKERLFKWPELVAAVERYNVLYLSLMLQRIPAVTPDEAVSVTVQSMAPFHKQLELFYDEVKTWLQGGRRVLVYMATPEKAASFAAMLSERGIAAIISSGGDSLPDGAVAIRLGAVSNGFEFPAAKLVVVAEKDIMGRQKRLAARRAPKGEQINYFRDINVGDYVVHVNHGIGKYLGVETLTVGGVHRDYLHIRYGGDDKLFVPTDQVNMLQKYIGSEGEVPRLNKMGGSEWLKAKTKARASVRDIAKELLRLYAARQVEVGYAFESDTPWQKEFEESFPFEETPDQLTAIAEIKADMERARPMDRLLCGDVGFGKTEVAIRAAFKAVMNGKQVAVLVPTTVLAQQHYQTFKSRFSDFGPTVDVVCRFRSAKQQKETFAKAETGRVDVLIGTHGILNANNVRFKDLGLLIVDEEQRFGVTQKEKIKKLSTSIDVLTLSATPIPRTLHMSLVGARDMSIIETPPEERFPVQTYVVENNDQIIRDAVTRELKRGGQVYFVYNRVETIDKMSEQLSRMLPDARIQTAHGQMAEELLEQVMFDFYEGRFDILLATSIIENGLDVANANTIIVYDADRFGLSQLYQMRGRVGRSNHMAFAYFVYQADKVLTEVAEKRLQAIKEFAELGSGFKIAMRDLEIRGAGNLLGSQQHGHIATVGFEMYCRMLEEEIAELKGGEPVAAKVEPALDFKVEAYIDGDYIGDAMHKIEVYQRIAAIRNNDHIRQLYDELIDRFGDPPSVVVNLLMVARIKNYARDLGIQSIVEENSRVEIIFSDAPRVEIENILRLRQILNSLVRLKPNRPEALYLLLTPTYKKKILNYVTRVLMILSGVELTAEALRPTSLTDHDLLK